MAKIDIVVPTIKCIDEKIQEAKDKGCNALVAHVWGWDDAITRHLLNCEYEFTISNPWFANEYKIEISWS